jgi:hypothetical protein
LQISIEHARCRRIAAPLGKSDDLEQANRTIETDRQHVAGFDGMTWSRLAHAIDPDMAGLDEHSGAGAGFDHPRMPQPFVETLALQTPPNSTARTTRSM